ncbi:unnamed protein product, partial [marine sediment metagenome]
RAEDSTSSATYGETVRLPATGDLTLPAGTYEIVLSYGWKISHTSTTCRTRLVEDTTTLGETVEHTSESTGDWQYETRTLTKVLTAADYNWSMTFSESGSYTAYVTDCQLSIHRTV